MDEEKTKIGHVPEQLAALLNPLWKNGLIKDVRATISGEGRRAPEGTWNQGGGIEVPCIYRIIGKKKNKLKIRNILKKN